MSPSILALGTGEQGGQSLKEAPGKKSKLRSKEVQESSMSPLGGARQRETIDTGGRQGAGGIGTEMAGDHAGPRAQASESLGQNTASSVPPPPPEREMRMLWEEHLLQEGALIAGE